MRRLLPLVLATRGAAAFTPGNVLALAVGDGTAAGAGFAPAGAVAGSFAAGTVAVQLIEYTAAGGGALAATGAVTALNASAFSVLGNVSDAGQQAPYGALPALSSDGLYVTFTGYAAPANSSVGVSTNTFGGATGSASTQNNAAVAVPPASLSRVIVFVDAGGAAFFAQGNLNAIFGAVPLYGPTPVLSAYYVAAGAASGFFVSGGMNNGIMLYGGVGSCAQRADVNGRSRCA
jgi:hypothetical protein